MLFWCRIVAYADNKYTVFDNKYACFEPIMNGVFVNKLETIKDIYFGHLLLGLFMQNLLS
jgi:hypothetical protein